jgi:hypothetical protein
VASELGNSPWSVFAEGLAVRTPLTVGTATVAVSFGCVLPSETYRAPDRMAELASPVSTARSLVRDAPA